MRAFAEFYGEDSDKWAMAGLLHDLDFEETSNEPQKHGLITAQILREKGIDSETIEIIKAHNAALEGERDTKAKKVIFSADSLTGLIVACALIHPEKKLSSIDTKFVLNRFKEKSFAAGARRDEIRQCEELDLSLEKFIEISLRAMQTMSQELGL